MKKSILNLTFAVWLLALSPAQAAVPSKHEKQSDQWLASEEGRRIADNVVSWQSPRGSWPKNGDTASKPFEGEREKLTGTFDNGATTGELRFLARAFCATNGPRYKEAFLKGLDHILEAQYDNGGWPQYFPPGDKYPRHITFNDGTIVRLMYLARDVAKDDRLYGFVDGERRKKCTAAWDKGLECILNCQIKVDGQPTVWCAQHDEVTLAPAKARAYELPSFSGGESAGVAILLMELEKPSDRVKQAVRGAALWYERNKLAGIKVERRPDKSSPKGFDTVVVNDADAPALWARFYDLETGKPFFCGRDGVKKSALAEIELERRTGYSYLGASGQKVLDAYPKWAAKHGMAVELK